MSLEEEFARLVADIGAERIRPVPNLVKEHASKTLTRTRTVYSVGEALIHKGQKTHAELARSPKRNTGS